MHYLIVGHGNYAIEIKRSYEMILGINNNIHPVHFDATMSPADLFLEYEKIIQKISTGNITVIVDIPGGTPCNTALQLTIKYPQIKIYGGLSLALMIELGMGESLFSAYEGVASGMRHIVPEYTSTSINDNGEEEM